MEESDDFSWESNELSESGNNFALEPELELHQRVGAGVEWVVGVERLRSPGFKVIFQKCSPFLAYNYIKGRESVNNSILLHTSS